MGVKKQHRLVLFLVCLILIGVTVYPRIPALVKVAQAVQGELKFGAAMDQVMTVINKTYYSADVFFGNGAGGTVGVLKGSGNVGIGVGTTVPTSRLHIMDSGTQPEIKLQRTPNTDQVLLIKGPGSGIDAEINSAYGLRFTTNQTNGNILLLPGSTGNVGIGSTAPTKKLDVVGDINFSGTLYQAGVAFQGSKWTNTTGGIYYNSGNVGVGTTAPSEKLDVNGNITAEGNFLKSTFVDGSTTNLIANGNFEKNTTGWGGTSTLSQQSGGYYGDYSMKLVYSGSGDNYAVFNLPNVPQTLANRPYTFSFYAKADSAGNFTSAPFLQPTAPYSGGCFILDLALTTSWKKFKVTCTFGAETSISWRAVLRSTGNVGNAVYFDGVQVQNGTSGTDYTSISTTGAGDTILYDGNVGIGTTNPQKKLDIVATNSTINNTSGNLNIVPSANLLITQGNVGIGTTGPLGKLDVLAGAARSGTHATTPSFYVTAAMGTGQTGPASGNVEFRHDNGTQGIGFGYNTIYQAGSNTNQDLNLLSKGTSPITLNAFGYSTGNVGIGTTAPVVKLDVGTTAGGQTTTSGSLGLIRNTAQADASPYTQARMIVYGGTGVDTSNWGYLGYGADAIMRIVYSKTSSANPLAFGTTSAMDGTGTFSETMRIKGDGNVGIGSTAPAAKLDVVGTVFLDVQRRTTLFPGSVLINPQQSDTINHWIGNPYQSWTLCFRKSTNGTTAAAWHAACDNKGQTVTIVSLSTGQLIGGYTGCSWGIVTNTYYSGCGTRNFLFNLTKGHIYSIGGEINAPNNNGIYTNPTYGPTFGAGHDLYIPDGLNGGYCNLGYSYACRKGIYGSAACQQDFCGTYNGWTITDLETWYVNN